MKKIDTKETDIKEEIMEHTVEELIEAPVFNDLEKETGERMDKDPKEALKLVRCIITCNNKNKAAYTGDIFCAGNSEIPTIKKFIQFGVPYHVPQIILNTIKERKCSVYTRKRLPGGGMTTIAQEIPEYSIQYLEPLTPEEIEAIKKKQLAEGIQ